MLVPPASGARGGLTRRSQVARAEAKKAKAAAANAAKKARRAARAAEGDGAP